MVAFHRLHSWLLSDLVVGRVVLDWVCLGKVFLLLQADLVVLNLLLEPLIRIFDFGHHLLQEELNRKLVAAIVLPHFSLQIKNFILSQNIVLIKLLIDRFLNFGALILFS